MDKIIHYNWALPSNCSQFSGHICMYIMDFNLTVIESIVQNWIQFSSENLILPIWGISGLKLSIIIVNKSVNSRVSFSLVLPFFMGSVWFWRRLRTLQYSGSCGAQRGGICLVQHNHLTSLLRFNVPTGHEAADIHGTQYSGSHSLCSTSLFRAICQSSFSWP